MRMATRIRRSDIDNYCVQLIRMRIVKGRDDDQSVIFNWAIKEVKREIETSHFSPIEVTEKFIKTMELYSVNDVANSWKWSICKDAGEYVLDELIWVQENWDSINKQVKADEEGRKYRRPPKIDSLKKG